MKSKMKNKVIAFAMFLAMAFTMMPIMGTPVYADDPAPAAICLANGAAPNIKGGQKHSIYFGNYPQSEASNVDGLTKDVDYIEVGNKKYLIEPIKWRVLDNPVDVYGNLLDKLLLLSDQNLDCKKYHEQYKSITWKYSTIRAWLDAWFDAWFKNTAFLSGEQEALKVTEVKNKVNPEYHTSGGENTQDQIFLLSIEEAANKKYGFTNNYDDTPTREAKNTAYATGQGASTYESGNGDWWLRSTGDVGEDAAIVFHDGSLHCDGSPVDNGANAVRPALNLNLSSALFTSAAVGGKSSGTVGADSLKPVGTNTTNEWKMTVKDEAHKDFKVDNITTCDGKTLTIKYSGAVKGDREYISAIITDQFGNIKYYGNLKQFADEDSTPDTAEVTIEGKMESTDTLYIINEQLNGDKKTDFSSPLQKVEIPTELHDWQFDGFEWQQPGQIVHTGGIYAIYSCKNDSAHTFKEHNSLVITVSSVEPTCDEDGGAKFTAEIDASNSKDGQYHKGEKEVLKPGTALGHKYGEWIELDATQHQRVCQHDATHVEKENHKWDAGNVTAAPTTEAEGVRTYTCTLCKETKTETITKLDPTPEPTPEPTPTPTPTPAMISGTPLSRITAGKTSLTISWNKIQGAEGYDIFFARCRHDSKQTACKNVKTITGNNIFKWTKSGLKKGTAYMAYVRAYVYKNGKKTYVRNSPLMHAYTGNGTKNYTNAKSVTVNKTKVTLKKGKTFKIKAKVNKVKKNKKLMPKSHASTLRYMTSNSKIASVNSGGKITAKGKGTCYIYVYAHNGVSKRVKVMVK